MPPLPPSNARNTVLATSVFAKTDAAAKAGNDCYSYHFVAEAFQPLLERWGNVRELAANAETVNTAAADERSQGREPLHVSFLPLQYMPVARECGNIGFPFWEFPEVPDREVNGSGRNNWVEMTKDLTLIISACKFLKTAFERAGVTTPVHVLPVPVPPEYFAVPEWKIGQQTFVDCHYHEFKAVPLVVEPAAAQPPPPAPPRPSLPRRVYSKFIKPCIPEAFDREFRKLLGVAPKAVPLPASPSPTPERPAQPFGLKLDGIVFTSIFNPFDLRKNWRDIITAFAIAMRDRKDATLVLKLAVSGALVDEAIRQIQHLVNQLGMDRKCRIVAISQFLSDEQMCELTLGSAFYVNASKAEGACLPLQNFMAAQRPGIAPNHTAISEYFDASVGFEVRSSSEPTHYPWDRSEAITTSWHRIDWQSLHDRIQEGYQMARREPEEYRALASAARSRMENFASREVVWELLSAALDAAISTAEPLPMAA